MTLQGFLLSSYGRQMHTTDANAGQCVGLVAAWLAANMHTPLWANAVDLLSAAAGRSDLRVVQNDPTNYPTLGDVVVWGATWGDGFGHCGVVLAADVNRFSTLEQNNPIGSPAIIVTHDYDGVLGWLYLV